MHYCKFPFTGRRKRVITPHILQYALRHIRRILIISSPPGDFFIDDINHRRPRSEDKGRTHTLHEPVCFTSRPPASSRDGYMIELDYGSGRWRVYGSRWGKCNATRSLYRRRPPVTLLRYLLVSHARYSLLFYGPVTIYRVIPPPSHRRVSDDTARGSWKHKNVTSLLIRLRFSIDSLIIS